MNAEEVFKLFKERKISSGQSAELLGLSLVDFLQVLKVQEIPFTRYTEQDWERDKEAVAKMMKVGDKKK